MTRAMWLERFYSLSPDNPCGACWQPAVDVYRDRDGWLVKVDLAGVAPQDIELSVRGHFITVAGVRRDLNVREGRQAFLMEIAYSRFERSVELPVELEALEIGSESHDGMLLVSIRRPGDTP